MIGIDSTANFQPIRIAVMTISDTRTMDTDTSGALLIDRLQKAGHILSDRVIIRDEKSDIEYMLREYISDEEIEVVLATGGTGVTGRDVTPEAFHAVYEKEIPGFGELFRMLSYKMIKTSAMQSRATAGTAGGTYLFALPGSTSACRDAWDDILVYQLDIRHRPCNFAELLPRLQHKKGIP